MNCPCGSARNFDQCCGPLLAGAKAPTAEALMRSRYTAYVRHQIDYLIQTHHPDTAEGLDRDATEKWARQSEWLGLQILAVEGGGEQEQEGVVEFAARFRQGRQEATHLERSRFRKLDGRWLYLDGEQPKRAPLRATERPGPNALCPCGSGKKFKRCHGT